MNVTRARRRATTFRRVGWLAVAAMATLALVGSAAGPVGANGAITPTVYYSYQEGNETLAGNPTCALLDTQFGGGQTWNADGEVKSDPPATTPSDKPIEVPGFGTITTTWNSETQTFSWTSTFGIDAVLFKAGQGNDGYNTLFVYAPTAPSPEAFAGSAANGSPTGLSHVSFCFDTDNPPTPTPVVTPTPTPTTPVVTPTPTPTTPVVTPTPTPVVTPTPTPTATPTGGVGGVTAKPVVTPPPTDTLGTTGQASGDSWRIALLAIAGLLAITLFLTPAVPARNRRR